MDGFELTRNAYVIAYLSIGVVVCLALVRFDHTHGHRFLKDPRPTDYLYVLAPTLVLVWPAALAVLIDLMRRSAHTAG
ncbi:hypothetical protein CHO01_36920 [Cellulomonas hominis]|uniref:Uncharacterized protein n=1 Tax=Cellulomonas hominis TaxID=156981 RepID=A0A511FH45_9CELL|nr:hypothetical protein [Cellulomonas hominis]MBB5474724.1 hypothetical protein [Cellulomonas hominis]NKY05986.1 hypothetical protein [Cellulomonas hominis]GEL48576.1 hypothetical protein CHO01_36920 [Cellulomonas hominis]